VFTVIYSAGDDFRIAGTGNDRSLISYQYIIISHQLQSLI